MQTAASFNVAVSRFNFQPVSIYEFRQQSTLDESGKSARVCREYGVFPAELDKWRLSATTALAEPEEARAGPQASRQDKRRIKELKRELLRKDRALAETAAPLVL